LLTNDIASNRPARFVLSERMVIKHGTPAAFSAFVWCCERERMQQHISHSQRRILVLPWRLLPPLKIFAAGVGSLSWIVRWMFPSLDGADGQAVVTAASYTHPQFALRSSHEAVRQKLERRA
jgi:hypothetical protein